MNIVKPALRSALRSFGLEVRRYRPPLQPKTIEQNLFEQLVKLRNDKRPIEARSSECQFIDFCLKKTHAQVLQDLFVRYELREKKNGFFVDIGATDGVTLNNSYSLEKYLGWTGIAVEPAKCWRDKLTASRSCAVDFRCVWNQTGAMVEFNEVVDAPALSTVTSCLEGDFQSEYRTHRSTYAVETVSLNDLLEQHNAPRQIDYLSIDTEGSELDILKSFDFRRWDVAVITIEHNYTANRAHIYKLLAHNGFQRKFTSLSHWDDWYLHEAR